MARATFLHQAEHRLLENLYVRKLQSPEEIAGRFGWSIRTFYSRLHAYGISRPNVNRLKPPKFCHECGQEIRGNSRKMR